MTINSQITEKNQRPEQELWSQLPMDLWKIIMCRLSCSDQARFHAVCKDWMALDKSIKTPSKSVPWTVICYEDPKKTTDIICELYEPLQSPCKQSSFKDVAKPSVVHLIDFRDYGIIPHCGHCIEDTFKYGWLFFAIRELCVTRTSFLLFSPFTNKIITLPPTSVFYKTWHTSELRFTFSADPTSPDCVFFVLHELGEAITVKTLCHGDKEWTSREFDRSCESSCSDVLVFVQGFFYLVHRNAQVESYNIVNGEWKTECPFISDNPIRKYPYGDPLYRAFELNGELMVIYKGIHNSSLFVTRFDRSNNIWVPVKSLGDQTVFLSIGNYFSVKAVGVEARNTGLLPNTVYLSNFVSCDVYYLQDSDKLTRHTDVSGCINWSAAGDFWVFWCEPPDQLVRLKHGSDPLSKWIREYTLLPVSTKLLVEYIKDDEQDN